MGRGGGAGGGGGRGMSGGAGGGRGFSSGGGGGSRTPSGGRGGGYPGGSPTGRGSMGSSTRPPVRSGVPGGMGRVPMGRMPRARRPVRGGMPAMGGMGCMGCLMPCSAVALVILVIALIMVSFGACSVGGGSYSSGGTVVEGDGITREKLESNLCTESSQWIDDELGWLHSQSTVKKAMQDFYSQTGVQPYLIITDNINGVGSGVTDAQAEAYLEQKYDSLYSDEGHMIFCFDEYASSEYMTYIYTGSAAKSVIDSSAQELILNLADRYYTDSSLSDDEFFARIFTDSANTLMKDYTSSKRTTNIIRIILVIGIILIIALMIWKHIQDSKTKEAEHLKDVLNTDLGASPSDQDLINKYGDSSSGTPGSDNKG